MTTLSPLAPDTPTRPASRAPCKFPVLERRELDHPRHQRRIFKRRRDLADLPVQTPGTTLVFQRSNSWEPAVEPLKRTSSLLVESSSVLLVQMASSRVECTVTVGALEISASALFQCKVEDPVAVLEGGTFDVSQSLGAYIVRAASFTTPTPKEQRARTVEATIRSYAALRPYKLDGMAVQFIDVSAQLIDGIESRDE